jgi:hypothetical protein
MQGNRTRAISFHSRRYDRDADGARLSPVVWRPPIVHGPLADRDCGEGIRLGMPKDKSMKNIGHEGRKRSRQPSPDWASGLRRLYDSVVEEPLPDSFSQLLDKLDSADD